MAIANGKLTVHLINLFEYSMYHNFNQVQEGSCLFFSIVWHTSKQHRKPATRGPASQHLRTFERGVAQNKQRYRRGAY